MFEETIAEAITIAHVHMSWVKVMSMGHSIIIIHVVAVVVATMLWVSLMLMTRDEGAELMLRMVRIIFIHKLIQYCVKFK